MDDRSDGETYSSCLVTKIEGHAKLTLYLKEGVLEDVRLDIYENPRFFEELVLNRPVRDVQLITSRICGVCGFVHGLASIHAVEDALGIEVNEETESLRDVLHLCLIGQSHVLHLGMMVLPDVYGKPSIFDVAREYPDLVKDFLNLRRAFTYALDLIGGRPIHVITPLPGGFTRVITDDERERLITRLRDVRDICFKLFEIYNQYPEFYHKTTHVALSGEYITGHERNKKIVEMRDDGYTEFLPEKYNSYLTEFVVPYSTSKLYHVEGRSYMLGALSRININRDRLSPGAKDLVSQAVVRFPSNSPYLNNLAQAIEVLHCVDESIRLLEELNLDRVQQISSRHLFEKDGTFTGIGVVEAPRGILYHRYVFEDGRIVHGDIIPPTSQFLFDIESAIKDMLSDPSLNIGDPDKIIPRVERLIRAYDPCVSCAAHFLELEVVDDA